MNVSFNGCFLCITFSLELRAEFLKFIDFDILEGKMKKDHQFCP